MDDTCARAVELGLPAVAFTEHVDFTPFRAGFLVDNFSHLVSDGILTAPELDVTGYLECVERCRAKYRDVRILSGLEVGQPHLHPVEVADLLALGQFDRVIGSLHCLRDGDAFAEPFSLFDQHPAETMFRDYLTELPEMVAGSSVFASLAHIDYPVRWWPTDAKPFDPVDFEDELRQVLSMVAASERALEINTKVPLAPTILGWWLEQGGQQVTFGSDAHEPWGLGAGLEEAAGMAEAFGFKPDRSPEDPWILA
jgi:histidinol-phosphatase (PHP family)